MTCKNCGAELKPDSMYCYRCGVRIINDTPNNQPNYNQQNNQMNNNSLSNFQINNQQASTPIPDNQNNKQTNNSMLNSQPEINDKNDTKGNDTKVIRMVSYLGILFLIGLLGNQKDDPDVKFHVGQGIILFIADIALVIAQNFFGIMGSFLGLLVPLFKVACSFVIFALAVIGIINAYKNINKPLPVIGKFAFYK